MSQKQHTQQSAKPDVMLLINKETRLRQLSYTLPGDRSNLPEDAKGFVPREIRTCKLTPGANVVVDPTFIDKCLFDEDLDGSGPLQLVKASELSIADAVRWVSLTKSRQALRLWLKDEKRAKVREAIEQRLEARGVK